MELIQSEQYDEMAATYQVFLIHWLNDSLESAGIEDVKKRRAIIEDFCFVFGVWHDQHWFQDDNDAKVFPVLCFSEQGPAADQTPETLGDTFMPSRSFSFKEYSNGNISYYFEELNEDISSIKSAPTFDDL